MLNSKEINGSTEFGAQFCMVTLLVIAMVLFSCKHSPPIEETTVEGSMKPFKIEPYNFRFIPKTGNVEKGCCGMHIYVLDTSDQYSGSYFPVSIPKGIDTSGRTDYTGHLKVLPSKTIQCRNCLVDPMPPNRLPAVDTFHKVEILEFEER